MLFNKSKNEMPHDAEQQLAEAQRILDTTSPIVHTLYSNQAIHFLGQGFDVILEILLYIAALGSFIFVFIMDTIFPFYVLSDIIGKKAYQEAISSKGDIDAFNIAIKTLVVIIGVLLILLAMSKRNNRIHKSMLQKSGKQLKEIETLFLDKKNKLDELLKKSIKNLESQDISQTLE
jgi:hypothetical protein